MQLFNKELVSLLKEPKFDLNTISGIIKKLEAIEFVIKTYPTISVENMKMLGLEVEASVEEISFMKRMLVSVVDSFGSLLGTLKTNIFNMFKTTKRSEIKFYTQSNILKIRTIENLKYNEVMDMMLPFPTGMVTTYLDNIKSIEECYNSLSIKNSVEHFKKIINDLYKDCSLDKYDEQKAISLIESVGADARKEPIVEAWRHHKGCYNKDEDTMEKKFSDLYKTMLELKDVKQRLLELEPTVQLASALERELEAINYLLERLLSVVDIKKISINKDTVLSLAEVVRFMAESLDCFGTVLQDQLVCEHKYTTNVDVIYGKVVAGNTK